MPRIMVVGPCGSGKSTFARRLGDLLRVPVIHMDQFQWRPGWAMTPRPAYDAAMRKRLATGDWILDGNTGKPEVHRAADTIVFLDMQRWLCMWRVIKRVATYAGQVRPDMAEGCPERIDWEFFEYIWNYHDVMRPRLIKRLEALGRGKRHVVLRSPDEVEAFFEATAAERACGG